MQGTTLAAVALAAVSPAVGSFLGVLADRLPEGRDPILARSRCAACGTRLGWSEMVPVLSYLAQRGRCRHCGAAIPGHLPRIEALAAGAALLAIATAPNLAAMLAAAVWLWCLIALFYSDLNHFRLPDPLTAALLAAGLALAWADPWRGLAVAAVTAAAAAAAFWGLRAAYRALRGREGLGLGDVKLIAGIGAGLGPLALPLAVLVGAGLGLAAAALEGWRGGRRPAGDDALPFGSLLAAGAALAYML